MVWLHNKKADDMIPQTWMYENVQNIQQSHKLHHGCHGKKWHADNEKEEKWSNGRNRTAKSGMNQNSWREINLHVPQNIGNGPHQTSVNNNNKKKQEKGTLSKWETKLCNRNLINVKNTWAVPLVRYSSQRKNSNKWTKGQESWWVYTKLYIREMT